MSSDIPLFRADSDSSKNASLDRLESVDGQGAVTADDELHYSRCYWRGKIQFENTLSQSLARSAGASTTCKDLDVSSFSPPESVASGQAPLVRM